MACLRCHILHTYLVSIELNYCATLRVMRRSRCCLCCIPTMQALGLQACGLDSLPLVTF
jgi:hypothetical protein